jgi:hypothetical protein
VWEQQSDVCFSLEELVAEVKKGFELSIVRERGCPEVTPASPRLSC